MHRSKLNVSEPQSCALREMIAGPLVEYRRGYARSKLGPFYSERTIRALERKGLVVVSKKSSKVRATKAGLVHVELDS